MKLVLNEMADTITDMSHLGISDILIDAINKKWDNVRDYNSIIVNLQDEGYEDMIPVIENILSDESKNVGKLQQLVELISPNVETLEDGKQEAIETIDSNGEIIEMKINENFDNTPDDIYLCQDNNFYRANKQHDEDKKEYEDAIKENEKTANETIPKEGETGKKVTSKELKAMHLSEALFNEEYDPGIGGDTEDFESDIEDIKNALLNISLGTNAGDEIVDDLLSALEDEIKYFKSRIRNESLTESKEDEMEVRLMKYIKKFQNHYKINSKSMGKALASIGKSMEILDTMDESLNESKMPQGLEESLKFQVAKEQLQRFNESKMPEDWTPEKYINKLVEKNHITKDEAKRLKEEFNG